jgi:hypothetical protein
MSGSNVYIQSAKLNISLIRLLACEKADFHFLSKLQILATKQSVIAVMSLGSWSL